MSEPTYDGRDRSIMASIDDEDEDDDLIIG